MKFTLAFLLCSVAHAANWYVAPTGNDGAAGTLAAPLATFQKAHDLAAPGDTILGMDGTFLQASGTACCSFTVYVNKPNLSFRALNRRVAILDGQQRVYSAFYCGPQCSGLTVQGFVIRNGSWAGIVSNSGNGKGLTVRDNEIGPIGTRPEISQTGIAGVFTDSAATGTIDGNYFHDIGRTNDVGNTYDHGVYSLGHFDITGNSFVPWNGWGIQTAGGFSGTISGNTFTGPVQFDGKAGQIQLWGANGPIVIANNISTGARGTFISQYAWSSPACAVYGNQVTGATLGLPAGCSTTPPVLPAQSVTVTGADGKSLSTTLPLTIRYP